MRRDRRLTPDANERGTAAGPTDRALYDWTYNRAGQILTEDSQITGDASNGAVTYGYDPLGQLTGSTLAGTTTAYAWDKTTNRTSVQVGAGAPATTAYDAANRPTSGASPSATYASDADGRLTARPNQTLTSSCSVGNLFGCPAIAPSELPSGAPPGESVEGVAGGAKQFLWGTGPDLVDLRVGLTYRGSGDKVLANVTVRGEPATVFQFGPEGQIGIGLEWAESDCDYNVFLAPEITAEELAEYARRY